MNRLTRRGLFAMLAAAVIGKPAVKGVSLALMRSWDSELLRRQYRTGKLNFHRDCFTMVTEPLLNPPNQLLTQHEITYKALQVLEKNTRVLPPFYRS